MAGRRAPRVSLPQGNSQILQQIADTHGVPPGDVRYVYATEYRDGRWTVRSDFEIRAGAQWRPIDWVGDSDGCYGRAGVRDGGY